MRGISKDIRYAVERSLLKMIGFIFRIMPRETGLAIGKQIGRLCYFLISNRRDRALRNLELAFGKEKSPTERKSLAIKSFESLAMNVVEFFSLPVLDRETLESIMEFKGEANLRNVLTGGQGAILLSAHLGNWDLATTALALKGYPVALLSKIARIRSVNDLWMDYRAGTGIRLFSGRGSMRSIFRHLKSGGVVCFVLDQNALRSDGVFVPFFGREACTLSSLAVIARRTGVPVLPAYTYRTGKNHRAVIEEPLPELSMKIRTDDILARTQQYTTWTEGVIRDHPDQWMWLHNRWKTRPKQSPESPSTGSGP